MADSTATLETAGSGGRDKRNDWETISKAAVGMEVAEWRRRNRRGSVRSSMHELNFNSEIAVLLMRINAWGVFSSESVVQQPEHARHASSVGGFIR